MIGENDSEETTELIRKTKHSDMIKADVENLKNIKRRYERLAKSNPNEFLGKRKDLTPDKISKIVKRFKDNGATILGGCCETRPAHIEAMAKLI